MKEWWPISCVWCLIECAWCPVWWSPEVRGGAKEAASESMDIIGYIWDEWASLDSLATPLEPQKSGGNQPCGTVWSICEALQKSSAGLSKQLSCLSGFKMPRAHPWISLPFRMPSSLSQRKVKKFRPELIRKAWQEIHSSYFLHHFFRSISSSVLPLCKAEIVWPKVTSILHLTKLDMASAFRGFSIGFEFQARVEILQCYAPYWRFLHISGLNTRVSLTQVFQDTSSVLLGCMGFSSWKVRSHVSKSWASRSAGGIVDKTSQNIQ